MNLNKTLRPSRRLSLSRVKKIFRQNKNISQDYRINISLDI